MTAIHHNSPYGVTSPSVTEAEAPTITVERIAHHVPVAHGDCIECGRPARYNLAMGIVLHDLEADHDACPFIVTQRAFAKLMADAVEQLERLAL